MRIVLLVSLILLLILFGWFFIFKKASNTLDIQRKSHNLNNISGYASYEKNNSYSKIWPNSVVIPVSDTWTVTYEFKNVKIKLSNKWEKIEPDSMSISWDHDVVWWGCMNTLAENGGCMMGYGGFDYVDWWPTLLIWYIGDLNLSTWEMVKLDRRLVHIQNSSDALQTYRSIMAKVYNFQLLQAYEIDVGSQRMYGIHARVRWFAGMNTFMLMRPLNDRIDYVYIIWDIDDIAPISLSIDDTLVKEIIWWVVFK